MRSHFSSEKPGSLVTWCETRTNNCTLWLDTLYSIRSPEHIQRVLKVSKIILFKRSLSFFSCLPFSESNLDLLSSKNNNLYCSVQEYSSTLYLPFPWHFEAKPSLQDRDQTGFFRSLVWFIVQRIVTSFWANHGIQAILGWSTDGWCLFFLFPEISEFLVSFDHWNLHLHFLREEANHCFYSSIIFQDFEKIAKFISKLLAPCNFHAFLSSYFFFYFSKTLVIPFSVKAVFLSILPSRGGKPALLS